MLISSGIAKHVKDVTIHREAEFSYSTCAYFLKGEIELYTDSERFLITAPCLLLIPPKVEYRFVVRKADEHYWCLFTPDSLPSGLLSDHKQISIVNLNLKKGMHKDIAASMRDVSNWWSAVPPRIPLADNALERALLLTLEEIRDKEARGSDKRIAAALVYIAKNLSGNLEVANIAEAVNLSPSRFASLFKQHAHTTPARYVEAKRLELAADFLLSSNTRISEISGLVGYVNPFHFSRRFHSFYGQSPREFRRQPKRNRYEIAPGTPSITK